jgi:hypothetical protein
MLLKIWTDSKLLETDVAKYCLKILVNLIEKESERYKQLMELKVADTLCDVLDQTTNIAIISEAISLAAAILTADQSCSSIMLEVLENKGLTKRI